MNDDNKFMKAALKEAEKAFAKGEVPIGAVIVKEGKIIAKGHNTRESKKNATHHAEIKAINKACKKLGGWRLCGCTIYVTLEPCVMCAGAIINSRIDMVIYGTKDERFGCCESVVNVFEMPFNHKPEIVSGVMQEECKNILQTFFKQLRKNIKRRKKNE